METLSDDIKFMIDFYITGVTAKTHHLMIVDPKSVRNLVPCLMKCLPDPLAPFLLRPTEK